MWSWVDPDKRRLLFVLLVVVFFEFVFMFWLARSEHQRFKPVRRGIVKTFKPGDVIVEDEWDEEEEVRGGGIFGLS